jgi:hypothetical protein
MYNPPAFREDRPEILHAILREARLAILAGGGKAGFQGLSPFGNKVQQDMGAPWQKAVEGSGKQAESGKDQECELNLRQDRQARVLHRQAILAICLQTKQQPPLAVK